jgi:HSP20 family protein
MSPFSTTLLPVRLKNKARTPAARGEFPLEGYRNDLESMFARFFGGWLAPFANDFGVMRVWDFDVTEDDKEIVVKAELPGFDEKEIDLQLAENMLTIKADKQEKNDEEYGYRSFRRSLTLPFGIDYNKIHATYRNGVLELHIPRAEGAKVKHITVKAV